MGELLSLAPGINDLIEKEGRMFPLKDVFPFCGKSKSFVEMVMKIELFWCRDLGQKKTVTRQLLNSSVEI